MEYANDLGDRSLLSKNTVLKAKTRSLVAWQHSTFAKVCPSLSFESAFYKDKKKLTATEIEAIEQVYALWEKLLFENQKYIKMGRGNLYLMGDFSLADIALLPSVLRFTSHHQVTVNYPLVNEWVARLLNRKYVKHWLDEAYSLDPIYIEGYYS
jgi:glutathione S-transferase